MILAGLYFGFTKPDPNLFLTPLYAQILKLYNGIDIVLNSLEKFKIRGIVSSGTCDLPAKSLFMIMTQYNGKLLKINYENDPKRAK